MRYNHLNNKILYEGNRSELLKIFSDLGLYGYLLYSEKQIFQHYKIRGEIENNFEYSNNKEDRIIYLDGISSLCFLQLYLFEKKRIGIDMKHLHHIPHKHYLDRDQNEFDLKTCWTIFDQIKYRDSNKKLYPRIVDIVDSAIEQRKQKFEKLLL